MKHILKQVVSIAVEAGNVALSERKNLNVSLKADQSEVTNADLAVNAVIIEGLKDLIPDTHLLSEEVVDDHQYEQRQAWDQFWLIDPIDGTKALVEGDDDFSVNIALIKNHRVVLGVVHVPGKNQTYAACLGEGSYLIEPLEPLTGFSFEPITPATPLTDRLAARTVVSTYNAGISLDFVKHAGLKQLVRSASARKMGLVAEGQADLYPRLQKCWEWDTAAGQIIIEEAGGAVLDLEGKPLTYNKRNLRNPNFVAVRHRADAGFWVEQAGQFVKEQSLPVNTL